LTPFFIGILFALDTYGVFRFDVVALFFVSMITLDMATTGINNYIDYKKALKREGYNYEAHNGMVSYQLSDTVAKGIIFVLLCVGAGAGLILYFRTDWVVLMLGIIGTGTGILYSYGPIPISRTPLGEIFSGLIMGGIIFFITVYIQIFEEGLIIAYTRGEIFHLHIEVMSVFRILWVSLPFVAMIAGIMLANNLCDLEDDIVNRRFTLPYFIGRKWGLKLFGGLYLTSYLVIVIAVILGYLPLVSLLVLLSGFYVFQNVRLFKESQDKATTFVVSVKNLVFFSGILGVSLMISILLNHLL
jgi:1,4-dihydroxy-2-naphthoate octaprenyltransferase